MTTSNLNFNKYMQKRVEVIEAHLNIFSLYQIFAISALSRSVQSH